MNRRTAAVLAAVVVGMVGSTAAYGAVSIHTAAPTPLPTCALPTGNPTHAQMVRYEQCLQSRTEQLINNTHPAPPPVTVTVPGPTQTVTVTATPEPAPAPTVTPTPTVAPTPTPTPTPPSGGWACSVPLGGSCGAYEDAAFSPNSNGWNSYVSNQDFGASGTQVVSANGPRDWQIVSNLSNDGGRVLTFPNAQQLFNNFDGSGWNGSGNVPFSALAELKITYAETSPQSGASYQFSPDLFFTSYPNDVMFWVDTHGRCNAGAYGPSLLGHFTMPDGSGWTAHRYDGSAKPTGNTGAEIILIKDGPGGQGTCAQEPSGVIDVKAGLDWLVAGGFMADDDLYILQTGWEITQSSNATFRVNDLSYQVTLK